MESKKLLLRQSSMVDDLTFERLVSPPDFNSGDKFATYGHQLNIYSVFKNYLAFNPTAKLIYTIKVGRNSLTLTAITGRTYICGQEISGSMIYDRFSPTTDYVLNWTTSSTKRHVIVEDTAAFCSIILPIGAEWIYLGAKVNGVTGNNQTPKHIHCTSTSSFTDGSTINLSFNPYLATDIFIPTSISILSNKQSFAGMSMITGVLNIPYSITQIYAPSFMVTPFSSIAIDVNNTSFWTDGDTIYSMNKTILYFCRYLCTTLTINSNCTTIYSDTFRSSKIERIIIPNTVTSIGGNAFNGSRLNFIDIPSSISSIGFNSFLGCPITVVNNRRLTPQTTSYIDLARRQAGTLHVYASALAVYQAHADWGQFGTILGDL